MKGYPSVENSGETVQCYYSVCMTKLSVNLNKVALLRNQRDIGYPSLIDTARLVLESGAHGITVHPRPDERHIRRSDIADITAFLMDWPDKDIEFNIEGYPDAEFIKLVTTHDCDQVTLVPDAPDQKTSDHGWNVIEKKSELTAIIAQLKEAGRRVSLFIDPDPAMAQAAADVGADRIELYTGPYATKDTLIRAYRETADAARKAGIGINAGHDLNLDNLSAFIAGVPDCAEVSIGHAITSDALIYGWRGAIAAYLTAIEYGHKQAKAA